MSPSEIAFLALGLVLGAAIGAAIVEAVRSRPAPRREVRVTISPNSLVPPAELDPRGRPAASAPQPADARVPEDAAWLEAPPRRLAASPPRPLARGVRPSPMEHAFHLARSTVPSTAVAIPVDRPAAATPARPSDAGGTPIGPAGPAPARPDAGARADSPPSRTGAGRRVGHDAQRAQRGRRPRPGREP